MALVPPNMTLRRVLVFHGYLASPSDHWFPWLRDELSSEVEVEVVELPDSSEPDAERWISTVAGAIGTPTSELAIVAHSLGAVTALHALDRLAGDWSLGGFVAVAGFVDPLPALPQLDGFTAETPDTARTAARTLHRGVVVSDDDSIVPPALTHRLAARLEAEEVTVSGGGHFLADEGVTTLPAVLRLLPTR